MMIQKRVSVLIGWMVVWFGLALPTVAQTTARVIGLDGRGVPGVTVAVAGQCTSRSDLIPRNVTGTAETDLTGGFNWTPPCTADLNATFTYTLSKPDYTFTNAGKFTYRYSFTFIVANVDERLPIVYAAPTTIPKWTNVSAADYVNAWLSNEMITAGFGTGLAATTLSASLPLPTTLGARKILIRDMNGKQAVAQIIFISPDQINFVMPSGLAEGAIAVELLDSGDNVRQVDLKVLKATRPSLFTADANGKGGPAGLIVRVKPGNLQSFEPLAQYDSQLKKWLPMPIDLGPSTDNVFLVLYGTGWRNFPSLGMKPAVQLGGLEGEVTYVGSQLVLAGLDQINVRIPRTLIGRGDVFLSVSFITDPLDTTNLSPGQPIWPLKIK